MSTAYPPEPHRYAHIELGAGQALNLRASARPGYAVLEFEAYGAGIVAVSLDPDEGFTLRDALGDWLLEAAR